MVGRRALLLLAGLAGFSGVLLAAIGSHSIDLSHASDLRAWQSANQLHLLHAAALLGLAALAERAPGRLPGWAGLLMVVGILMFSGSIYLHLLTGMEAVQGLAPVGGLSLMAGWLVVMVSALREWPVSS